MIDTVQAVWAVVLLAYTVHAANTVTMSSQIVVVNQSVYRTTILLSTELGAIYQSIGIWYCASDTSGCSTSWTTFPSYYIQITTPTEEISSTSWDFFTTVLTSDTTLSTQATHQAVVTVTATSSLLLSNVAVQTNIASTSPSEVSQAQSTDRSSGVKAATAVSVILGVGLGIAVPLFIMRHRRNKRQQVQTDAQGERPAGSADPSDMSATREKDLANHMASTSEVREDVGVYKAFHPSYAGHIPQISELASQTRQSVYEMDVATHKGTIR